MVDYYRMIFKRKSFHLFRETERITEAEVLELQEFISRVKPLDPEIPLEIKICSEEESKVSRGAQFNIEFYSEEKGNYLRNIGYMGEQIDLWLAAHNIGALWYGIGKSSTKETKGKSFVIMIAIAKAKEKAFRKDMFKAKRKPLTEIWSGDSLGIGEIVRFAPSACNTQPWYVENDGKELFVYRYKKSGKRGIMPKDKVIYYNRIDMGIFLFFLETCLLHEGFCFEGQQFFEEKQDEDKPVLCAKYRYWKELE